MKFATSCSISFACIIAALSLTAHSVDGMNERQEAGRDNRKKERKQRLGSSFARKTSSSSFSSLLEEAGKPVQKIIGGEEAPTDGSNLYPWFTQMMQFTKWRGWEWAGCGGVLVAPEYVLTAAQCVGSRLDGVLVGALCPSEEDNCGQPLGPIQPLYKVFVHPDFDRNIGPENDFALVKLQTRSEIIPVDMDDGTESYVGGEKLWAMGFGFLNVTTRENPDVLHHVEISYITNEVCSDLNPNPFVWDEPITDNMMCAADPGQSTCYGDSGGPLYDKVNGKVVGVVSWGPLDCALPGDPPGVYSRISSQIDWIKGIICVTGGHSDPAPEFCEGEGFKRCIPNNSEQYEDYVHGSWTKMDLAPGTKCCIDPDDPHGSIIQQHVAMECPCLPFRVNIEPDGYPWQTSWSLTNLCTGEEVAAASSPEDYEECLPQDAYNFTIFDFAFDGICCIYGEGSYSVTYNGDEVASGGEFGSFETTLFREGFCSESVTPVGKQRCIPDDTTHFEEFAYGNWNKMDLVPGTKCCIDPDDHESIIQQLVAMECPCLPLSVNIEPDRWPSETSWSLTNLCTGVEVAAASSAEDYEECLPQDAYEFTISDSWGDGICCFSGLGSYSVTYGGDEVASGGDFGFYETTPFREGFCSESVTPVGKQRCIPDNTTHFEEFVYGNWKKMDLAPGTKCCPGVTGAFDSDSNIIQISETEEDCPCKLFELTIVPDYSPEETSWFVAEAFTDGKVVDDDDLKSTNIAYGDTYTKEICLPTNTEYVFYILDSSGNGICCLRGEGSYKVAFGGEVVKTGGTFADFDRVCFGGTGENCPKPTSA